MRILGRYLLTLVLAAAGTAAGVALLARPALAFSKAAKSRTSAQSLKLADLSERSVLTDRYGNVIAVLHADENRSPVSLDEIPPHVVDAVLDVEDDSFYEHHGVNVRAIVRAAAANAEAGGVAQGGSTITQQLVKNQLLTPERDLSRKVKEAVLAVQLERQMTKAQILQEYLNTVYFGNGAYGIQAAAETYWGESAKDLTIEQGAFLAGIIRNPVGYDPFLRYADPQKTWDHIVYVTDRRNYALDRMVARGHLAKDEAARLKKVMIPLEKREPLQTHDPYFVEEVKQRLLDDPRLGETPAERYNALFRGGLRIETTFDPHLQQLAEDSVRKNLPDTKGRFQAAVVSVEPATGAVRAMVAGNGFGEAQYNLATGRGGSGRQPGSSFKPYVLVTALENGYSPNDTIPGTEPCPVRMAGVIPNPYLPGNYEGSKGSNGPIWQATAKSLNCAFVRLGVSLDDDPAKSLEKVADVAHRLGLHIGPPYGPAMALGAKEVTPLEQASAYATIANDGVRHEPYFVQRVLDRDGKVVFEQKDEGKRVIDANVARAATWTLQKVVQGGTGTAASLGSRPVAGKTGTSENYNDAWFVGYVPQLATAVWMGSPAGQIPMTNVGGIRVTGGSYPARIWAGYMRPAVDGLPAVGFPAPNLNAWGKVKAVKIAKVAGGSGTSSTPTTVRRRPATTAKPTETTQPPDSTDVRTSIANSSGGNG
ncbi:MAG TPA: transglycosylase domain-containing protein [Acidimicrobiales bacterium]|nr:transglycosylase domain-containing protein [Acidimicrobiales bacterium]